MKRLAIIAKIEKVHRDARGISGITFTDGTELTIFPLNVLDSTPNALDNVHFEHVFIDALAPEEVKHKAAHAIHARNDEENEGTIETL